jgi:hypothetical protein
LPKKQSPFSLPFFLIQSFCSKFSCHLKKMAGVPAIFYVIVSDFGGNQSAQGKGVELNKWLEISLN